MMDWSEAAQKNGLALASWPRVKALGVFTRLLTLRSELDLNLLATCYY